MTVSVAAPAPERFNNFNTDPGLRHSSRPTGPERVSGKAACVVHISDQSLAQKTIEIAVTERGPTDLSEEREVGGSGKEFLQTSFIFLYCSHRTEDRVGNGKQFKSDCFVEP